MRLTLEQMEAMTVDEVKACMRLAIDGDTDAQFSILDVVWPVPDEDAQIREMHEKLDRMKQIVLSRRETNEE